MFSRLGIQVSLAIYVCLSGSWLGELSLFSFIFSYASVLNTCISMYVILVLILIFTVEPMDYGALSSILMFGACESRDCVSVTIVDDLVDELEEFFRATLERTNGLDNRITLNPVDGQIEITDNDGKYTPLIYY